MIKLSHQNRRDAIVILKIMTPVIFLIIIAIYFHEFIVNAVKANLAINLGIISAATYGVILILIRLVNAQMDFRVIERFGTEASQGIYMKTLLEEPWLKKRYVRHYLSHIANTGGTVASQLDQSAIESELHALQIEYDSKLELPQFLVGFMIAMGLLGTFIGLLETLTGISGMLDGMGGSGANVESQFMKLVVELRKPLAGMGIAFSASMFGLITSLMLAVMMTNLRRYINRVMSLARNVMHDLTELTRGSGSSSAPRSLSPEDIAAMAMETPAPAPASPQSSVSNTLLAGRFDVLSKKMELMLDAFQASNASVQKMTDLLGFGPRMKELSEKTLDELKAIYVKNGEQQILMRTLIDAHSSSAQITGALLESQRQTKDVGEESLNAIRSLAAGIADQHTALTRTLIESRVDASQTAATLLDAQRQARGVGEESLSALKNLTLGIAEQHQISRQMVEHESATTRILGSILESQKQAKEGGDKTLFEIQALGSGFSEQRRLVQGLIDVGTVTGRTAEGILDSQRQFRGEIAGLMQNLAERLVKMEEGSIGSSRHLWEIKENFIKLCKSLGVVDLIASGISGQALLLETLVEETRNSQKTLASLREDIQGSGGRTDGH